MQCLSIDINNLQEETSDELIEEFNKYSYLNIRFVINEAKDEELTSITCSIDNDNITTNKRVIDYDELIAIVSNVLADFIIKRYEKKLIYRIINANYFYFTAPEKKEILRMTSQKIDNEDKNLVNCLMQIRRKNIILKNLVNYFTNINSVIIEGFVNFRLKEYVKDLEDIVEQAVDEFLMEREYREFIRLLRYFVDIQEPKLEIINVIVDREGKYLLLDKLGMEISDECIQEFINELVRGEINYDDLLVSSLITLAPQKIVIHGIGYFKNNELLQTIKHVFRDKVTLCEKCEVCTKDLVRK